MKTLKQTLNMSSLLALAFVGVASLSACSDSSDDDKVVTPNVTVYQYDTPNEDLTALNYTLDGGSTDFHISHNIQLTVESSDDSWCHVKLANRANNTHSVYTVSVDKNETPSARVANINITGTGYTHTIAINQESGLPQSVGMASNAKDLAAKIFACVNIGNTMEVPSGETGWGNPKVSAEYIAGLKALGFNAVRIPCAWHSHMSNADKYIIDPVWMARVTEVVGYCLKNDMYIILNCHWDDGWLEDNIFKADKEEAIAAEQKAIWTQVAENFKDYDEHLIFAGSNEPGMNETAGNEDKWADAEAVARLVKYEQIFIDAVRATGSNNATRCLVVQGLGASISSTSTYMSTLPVDAVKDRMMVEVHFYEPYQFALMEEDATWGKVFWYWGKDNHKTGSAHNATWGEESLVTEQFGKMKSQFVDKGIPVIIGEYCARVQTASNVSDKTEEFDAELHQASRAYFNEVVTREAKNYGCVPCYWEIGSEISRTDGTAKLQYAIDGLMKGAKAGVYPF